MHHRGNGPGAETAKGSIRAEEVTKVMGAGSERS